MERASVQQARPGDAIDFFDFLAEMWREKWLVVGIVVVCLLLAAALTVSDAMKAAADLGDKSHVYRAAIPFRINASFDPYARSNFYLWDDFERRLEVLSSSRFVRESAVPDGVVTPASIYRVQFINIDGQNSGFNGIVYLSALGGDAKVASDLQAHLLDAANQQFKATVQQARDDEKTLTELSRSICPEGCNAIAAHLFGIRRFLNLSEVATEVRRFVEVDDSQQILSEAPVQPGFTKIGIMGLGIGVVLASMVVAARLGFARRRAAAKAYSSPS